MRKCKLAEETRARARERERGTGRAGWARERGSHPFGGIHKGDAREHRLLVIQFNSPIG